MRFHRRPAVALATILLCLGSCVFAQSQQPQQDSAARGAQQQAAPDPRGTDALPLIVQVQPAPKTDAETAEEQRQIEQDASDRWLTRTLAITAGILGVLQLFAIGFQAYIAKRQNRIIEQQNTIMNGQREAADKQSDYMRDGLIETRKAAEAAASAAHTADVALRVVHQQWLDLDGWRIVKASGDGGTLCLDINFQIINKTPMKVTVTGIKTRCLDLGHEAEAESASAFDLPPGADYPGTAPPYQLLDTPKDYAAYITKQLRITLIGDIRFIDAFGDNRLQRFGCLVIGGKSKDGAEWEFRRFDASLSHFPEHHS